MLKSKVLELNPSLFELEIDGTLFLGDNRFLLKHMEEVLNVNTRLVYLPKKHSHIEKRTS